MFCANLENKSTLQRKYCDAIYCAMRMCSPSDVDKNKGTWTCR